MFTGIIESLCEIKSINEMKKGNSKYPAEIKFSIDIGNLSKGLKIGKSIAVNGVCLTITKLNNNIVEFSVIGETVRKTCLDSIKKGEKVNIERSMRVSDRFDGHFVQGHVDCTGIIYDKIVFPTETKLIIKISEKLKESFQYIVRIDGISLTVVDIDNKNLVSISLIPHTLKKTTLGIKSIGDKVNIEFDIIGKYISRLLP